MVMLRPTRKLQTALPVSDGANKSDTALGDWYVNRIVVDRRPLLLLVSSASLLPILVPARAVRDLPKGIGEIVAHRLARLDIPRHLVEAEQRAMTPVGIGATCDRSVLGIMVDFAKAIPHYLEPGRWDATISLALVEDRLGETPCYAGKPGDQVVFPAAKASELLVAKWAG